MALSPSKSSEDLIAANPECVLTLEEQSDEPGRAWQWHPVRVAGVIPSARHCHSLVAFRNKVSQHLARARHSIICAAESAARVCEKHTNVSNTLNSRKNITIEMVL
jgi:hypothetical protein